MHGEHDRIAAHERHHLGARLHARALFGDDELAAREILAGLRQENGHLQREDVFSVEVLMQAIVVAGRIAQQQWRGAALTCAVTLREIVAVCGRILRVDAHRRVPAVRDIAQRRVERFAQRGDLRRQRVSEVLIFALPEPVTRHHDTAAETRRRGRSAQWRAGLAVHRAKRGALARVQQLWNARRTIAIEFVFEGGPIERQHARAHCVTWVVASPLSSPSWASKARLRSTPQR